MPSLQEPLLIVTDLDGTLLDIHTYDWQPAAPWLDKLREAQIPVVLCSSKTAAEISAIQRDLGLVGRPFIAENGAVLQPDVRWDGTPRRIIGLPHRDIVPRLAQLRLQAGYKFTTFDEVDERIVGEWTGLNRARSALARRHEASVTLVWRDSDQQLARFDAALTQQGLKIVQGARFWHVLDARAGKDRAVRWLIHQYRQREASGLTTIGLGDGPNDAPLLDSVDFAVVVKGFSRQGVPITRDAPERVYHTRLPGPEGWCEGLDRFLSSSSPQTT